MKTGMTMCLLWLVAGCNAQRAEPSTTAVDEQASTGSPVGMLATATSTDRGHLATPPVEGPSPVGTVSTDMAPLYPITVRVTNDSEGPLDTSHAGIAVRVRHDDAPLTDCAAPPDEATRVLEGPASLAPGESHTYTVGLPCALPEAGEYQIFAYLHLGERAPNVPFPVSDETLAGAFYMKVVADLEPFSGQTAPAPASQTPLPDAPPSL